MKIISQAPWHWNRQSVSFRLLTLVVLCSSFFTLIASIYQIYFYYQDDINFIHDNMEFVQNSYLSPISGSLYTLDYEQLDLLLHSVIQFQDLRHVELLEFRGGKEVKRSVGDPNTSKDVVREFPLVYFIPSSNETYQVGTLIVSASFEEIYKRTWEKAFVVIITNAVKMFLASFFILIIFQSVITRHLVKLAKVTQQFELKNKFTPVALDRKTRSLSKPDEFDLLVGALNHMQERIGLDIEKREETEETLRQSEERFRTIYENAPVFIDAFDQSGKCVLWNEECQKVFGWTIDEINAHGDALALFYPDPIVRENVIRTVTTDPDARFREWHPVTKHGEKLDTMWANFRLPDGLTYNIGYDNTERKQAEEDLEKAKNLLNETEKVGKIGGWTVDLETMTQTWTEETYRIHEVDMDFKPDVSKGINFYAPSSKPIIERAFYHTVETGEPFDLELELITAKGNKVWVHSVGKAQQLNGVTKVMSGSFQDITERKLAEEEKLKLEIRLQQSQKMESIGTLAGGIAHDFNNILAAMLGYAEMAKDDCQPGSTISKDLNEVLEAGNRAKSLVRQILAFSRQDDTERMILQPASIVKETITMLRPSLPTTIEITQDIDPVTGLVFVDPTQLNQILMNLCTNAFHAMEDTGGKLDISLKEVTLCNEDLVHEPDVTAGTFIQLSIGDSGTGIAPTVKEKIFDPYFTTKEAGKGTGMGLSMVHGIVKQYGGFISFYSELGEGTVFYVFLPTVEKEVSTENDINGQIPIGRERILFVDDEEILAKMGKTMLERLGYHVTVRNSSLEALETFQNQPDEFDIVITDQTMPGMTGSDLSRRMLQIRPDIPIILCTGYSTIITEEKAKSMGIKEFAFKPIAKKDISKLVRKVLDVS